MKFQILFSGKNNINLSSAELAQGEVKVIWIKPERIHHGIHLLCCCLYHSFLSFLQKAVTCL